MPRIFTAPPQPYPLAVVLSLCEKLRSVGARTIPYTWIPRSWVTTPAGFFNVRVVVDFPYATIPIEIQVLNPDGLVATQWKTDRLFQDVRVVRTSQKVVQPLFDETILAIDYVSHLPPRPLCNCRREDPKKRRTMDLHLDPENRAFYSCPSGAGNSKQDLSTVLRRYAKDGRKLIGDRGQKAMVRTEIGSHRCSVCGYPSRTGFLGCKHKQ